MDTAIEWHIRRTGVPFLEDQLPLCLVEQRKVRNGDLWLGGRSFQEGRELSDHSLHSRPAQHFLVEEPATLLSCRVQGYNQHGTADRLDVFERFNQFDT